MGYNDRGAVMEISRPETTEDDLSTRDRLDSLGKVVAEAHDCLSDLMQMLTVILRPEQDVATPKDTPSFSAPTELDDRVQSNVNQVEALCWRIRELRRRIRL